MVIVPAEDFARYGRRKYRGAERQQANAGRSTSIVMGCDSWEQTRWRSVTEHSRNYADGCAR